MKSFSKIFKLRFTLADQLISCKFKTILLLKGKVLEKLIGLNYIAFYIFIKTKIYYKHQKR